MRTIVDVAAYILDEYGSMTTMKLQKLAFYSQARYLATHNTPLFHEDFQAWVNGPVAPELYREHRGMFLIRPGDLSCAIKGHAPLGQAVKEEIDAVCSRLAKLTGNQLSAMTHREVPWLDARKGYGPSDYCDRIITKSSILSYYSAHPVWEVV